MRRLLFIAAVLAPTTALAHIHLTSPLSRTDSAIGDPQKSQHCGGTPGRLANRVSTHLPGATITVTWNETVNHPGYFRIAFQPAGETFGIPPVSTGPGGACNNFPTENLEGMIDPVTGSMILKDRIADGTSSIQVTLPNMECDNCTLQLIQVMTDKCPYTVDTNSDDIYFNCADITLSSTAPPPPPPGDGVPGGDDAGTEGGGGNVGGGCSTGAGGGALVAFALVGLRRRRRARERMSRVRAPVRFR